MLVKGGPGITFLHRFMGDFIYWTQTAKKNVLFQQQNQSKENVTVGIKVQSSEDVYLGS